jgi:hypothetical protein
MIKYSYKLQGDGRNSWRVDKYDGQIMIESYMIYENDDKYLKVYETLLELGLIPNV